MNLRAKIAVAAGVLLLARCRELPRYFAGDTTIARAGGKDLRLGDVRSVVPQGLSGDDSAAFMKVYIDRWVLKQLKLQEAETLFSSSAGDIDKMENLGIYEVVEEDFALCEFVDPSKIEIQQIIRDGINLMIKEA